MHNFFDWKIYSKGLGPREYDRVLNKKYTPELSTKLAAKGYEEEELLQQIMIYEGKNWKQIEKREERSRSLKNRIENSEK